MRQLIARIDDELHRQLKERAADEHRSLNALVVELLAEGVADHQDDRSRLARFLARDGRRTVPPPPARAPSLEAAIASTRGAGTAASDALNEDRSSR